MARVVLPALFALIASFVYYRSGIIYTFYANTPAKLQKVNHLDGHEVRFQDVVRNCEDVYLNDEEGWVLLSCDPGRDEWNTVMGHFINSSAPPETGLYLYNYASSPEKPPRKIDLGHANTAELQDFHPLGLEYHAPSKTLIVANHATTHSKVEIYRFNPSSEDAGQLDRTLEGPQFAAPNSFAMLNEKEFFFTNDHYFIRRETPILATMEEYAGIPGGTVNYVKLLDDGNVTIKTLARMSFANGVGLLNNTHLAAASTSSAFVNLYKINYSEDGEVTSLSLVKAITVPFLPDNLSVDSDGKLLTAGHPHAPSIGKVSANNRHCNKVEDAGKEECQLPKLSWVSEWSEQDGLKTLYISDDFAGSTTMVRDGKRGFGLVVGLYERGVLMTTKN